MDERRFAPNSPIADVPHRQQGCALRFHDVSCPFEATVLPEAEMAVIASETGDS
jgi:hypothetical protein